MSPNNAPTLVNAPTRMGAPADMGALPKLEAIHEPIYSTLALDAGVAPPNVNELFKYAQGETVAGAGNGAITATDYHTSMLQGGSLPMPQFFRCVAARVMMAPLHVGAGGLFTRHAAGDPNVGSGAALQNSDLWDDFMGLFWSGSFEFTVGPKLYIRGPLWLFPANVGVHGLTAMDLSVSGTNTEAADWLRTLIPHTIGRVFDISTYPIRLWPNQTFVGRLKWQHSTNYFVLDDRYLQVVLEGVKWREVS